MADHHVDSGRIRRDIRVDRAFAKDGMRVLGGSGDPFVHLALLRGQTGIERSGLEARGFRLDEAKRL